MNEARIQELAEAYLSDDLDEASAGELLAACRDDPQVLGELVRQVQTHGLLCVAVGDGADLREPVLDAIRRGGEGASLGPEVVMKIRRRRRRPQLVAALVGGLGLAIAALLIWAGSGWGNGAAIARQTFAEAPVWTMGAAPDAGGAIRRGELFLESGVSQLTFANGALITLEGETALHIVDAMEVHLRRGLLTAVIPPEAHGFRILTPDLLATDHGTSFGVRVDEGGGTDVSVFDGEVEVSQEGAASIRLLGGDSARGDAGRLEESPFITKPWEQNWSVSSGIHNASGGISVIPPGPVALREFQEDGKIHLLFEKPYLRLEEALVVDFTGTGEAVAGDSEPYSLQAGTQLRSYLLTYDPTGSQHRQRSARIRFAGPVLGVIYRDESLLRTDPLLRHEAVDYGPPKKRGAELDRRGGGSGRDVLSIAPDGRTLHLQLHRGRQIDQVRVLVGTADGGDL